MNKKFKIKKGDTVQVITGNSRGKTGTVLEMIVEKDKVLVEGINMVSRHTKPSAKTPNGGILKKEMPVHISNLMLVDGASGKTTRVGRKSDEKGKLVRFSKKSGEVIK